MIIPVKCFTCGNVLADKYRYYQQEVRRIKTTKGLSTEKVVYLTKTNVEKTTEGEVLDDLGLIIFLNWIIIISIPTRNFQDIII